MRFRPKLISRRDWIEKQKRDITAHALKIVASIQNRAGLKKDRKQAREFAKIVQTVMQTGEAKNSNIVNPQ